MGSSRYFFTAWAVLAVYVSVDALVFCEKHIVVGSNPSLALMNRCFARITAGFLGYLTFVYMQELLRAPTLDLSLSL